MEIICKRSEDPAQSSNAPVESLISLKTITLLVPLTTDTEY